MTFRSGPFSSSFLSLSLFLFSLFRGHLSIFLSFFLCYYPLIRGTFFRILFVYSFFFLSFFFAHKMKKEGAVLLGEYQVRIVKGENEAKNKRLCFTDCFYSESLDLSRSLSHAFDLSSSLFSSYSLFSSCAAVTSSPLK